jgi:hypothetical protein
MCYADVTPFLHELEPGAELGATPDFNTQHKCKRFDKFKSGSEVITSELLPGKLRFMDMITLKNPCRRMKVC